MCVIGRGPSPHLARNIASNLPNAYDLKKALPDMNLLCRLNTPTATLIGITGDNMQQAVVLSLASPVVDAAAKVQTHVFCEGVDACAFPPVYYACVSAKAL